MFTHLHIIQKIEKVTSSLNFIFDFSNFGIFTSLPESNLSYKLSLTNDIATFS